MSQTPSRLSAWIVSRDKALKRLEGKAGSVGKEYFIKVQDLFSRFEAVRMITPSSFLIYQGPKLKNPDRLLLFALLKETPDASAYLSLMTYENISEEGTSIFTRLPWLSERDTLRFYEKMQRHKEDSLRTGSYNWIRNKPHPLQDPLIKAFLERSS
jgi:hypothetical protein